LRVFFLTLEEGLVVGTEDGRCGGRVVVQQNLKVILVVGSVKVFPTGQQVLQRLAIRSSSVALTERSKELLQSLATLVLENKNDLPSPSGVGMVTDALNVGLGCSLKAMVSPHVESPLGVVALACS
jgi:hypothetical protein